MRVFLLDNLDSFTYNLVQYFQILGAQVKVERPNEDVLSTLQEYAPHCAVISPGPRGPFETPDSVRVFQKMIDLPILGVSLWHQCMGVGRGIRPVFNFTLKASCLIME